MYKSTARSLDMRGRTGSYSTRGNGRGVVHIVPRDIASDWDPAQFAKHYEVAQYAIAFERERGVRFREGADAAAAFAACHYPIPARARDALKSVLEWMTIHDD